MSAIILFLFPLDFIRMTWIITPFDFIAIFYIIKFALSVRLIKSVISPFFVVYFLMSFVIITGAIINSEYFFENFTLWVGTGLSFVKALALVLAILDRNDEFYMDITKGFFWLNVIMVAMYLTGFGFTGSGRFFGLIGHSNGLASYAVFSFAVSFFTILKNRSYFASAALAISIFLTLISGSRGGFIALMIVASYAILKITFKERQSYWRIIPSAILILIFYYLIKDSFIILIDAMYNSEIKGISRIGILANSIISGDGLTDLDGGRSDLNLLAYEIVLNNPTFFGGGYESSAIQLGDGNRVHNIFLSSLIELGGLGFFIFFAGFSYFLIYAIFCKNHIDLFFSMIGVAFWFAALKTPYYFLNSISWAVFVFPFISMLRKNNIQETYARKKLHT